MEPDGEQRVTGRAIVVASVVAVAAALIVVHVPYTIGLAAYPYYRGRNDDLPPDPLPPPR